MGQSINGYDIIFQAVVGEQKKLFAGRNRTTLT